MIFRSVSTKKWKLIQSFANVRRSQQSGERKHKTDARNGSNSQRSQFICGASLSSLFIVFTSCRGEARVKTRLSENSLISLLSIYNHKNVPLDFNVLVYTFHFDFECCGGTLRWPKLLRLSHRVFRENRMKPV